jgi:hypothetical protein
MDCFIKKVFDAKSKEINDNLVHVQFQKFSRGEFKDKAVIIASQNKGKYSISTTYEYANDLVRALAEKLEKSGNKAKINGVIVSTRDLTGMINFSDKKQFAGVKQYFLDCEMSGSEIIALLDKLPTAFFALSFSLEDGNDKTELKIKPKAPISGKPSTKAPEDQKVKADFCKLITNDKCLFASFVFDSEILNSSENIKKAEITHVYLITDIEIPKGEKDPAKMRENAIRKGKIIRTIKIFPEEKIIKKEKEFSA